MTRIVLAIMFFLAGPAVCLGASEDDHKLFELKCSSCHGVKKATSKAMNEAQWRSTILRMKGNGADLSREDIDRITTHLAKNYPKK